MQEPSHATTRSHTPKGSRARDVILAAAERLFAEHGFHGTSMRDIAERAGVPLANVVYHFAKKERLYADVLGAIAAPLEAELGAVVDAAPRRDGRASHAARLDGVVRALVTWTRLEPRRVKLLLRELLDNPARVAKASRLPLAPVLQRLSDFVADGVRAGAFRDVVPEVAVLHLVGAVSYVAAARPTLKRIVGPAREARIAKAYEREAVAFARRTLLAVAPEVPQP